MHQPIHDELHADGHHEEAHDAGNGAEATMPEDFEQHRRSPQREVHHHAHCQDGRKDPNPLVPVGVLLEHGDEVGNGARPRQQRHGHGREGDFGTALGVGGHVVVVAFSLRKISAHEAEPRTEQHHAARDAHGMYRQTKKAEDIRARQKEAEQDKQEVETRIQGEAVAVLRLHPIGERDVNWDSARRVNDGKK